MTRFDWEHMQNRKCDKQESCGFTTYCSLLEIEELFSVAIEFDFINKKIQRKWYLLVNYYMIACCCWPVGRSFFWTLLYKNQQQTKKEEQAMFFYICSALATYFLIWSYNIYYNNGHNLHVVIATFSLDVVVMQ